MLKHQFKHVLYLLAFSGILVLASCVSRKEVVYFIDASNGEELGKIDFPPTVIHAGDLLSIQIYSSDPEAVIPFNLHQVSVQTGGQSPGYTNGVASRQGYPVTSTGTVLMPVLGDVTLGGLSIEQAVVKIQELLTPHLKDPAVHIRILNFRVTVLGDVRAAGTFTIPNDQITLPEALGIAGDLNITGIRNNVLVIREEAGKRVAYRVDLTSKKAFSSPAYQLKQNDIVYVEPNRAQRNASGINARAGVVIAAVSLVLSVLILFK
jgi:polysaccharide export outer membrane protein